MEPALAGRYDIAERLAAGGMASVHLGRARGAVGFARAVAIKRLHSTIAHDPSFVAMFIDEARLAARIRHPNVVPTLDVVEAGEEILVVMEYVHGETLGALRRTLTEPDKTIPVPIAVAIMSDALSGLHAAHEMPLGIVHRDVSPQNIMVGVDGMTRLLDFGVAKAQDRIQTTAEGQVKGKFAYMAPEQFNGAADRRSDVYSAAVVLWEMLVGRKLFEGKSPAEILASAIARRVPPPRTFAPDVPGELEDVVMRGLEADPPKRFATAREMNEALLRAAPRASAFEVGEWLRDTMPDSLAQKAELVSRVERGESVSVVRTRRRPRAAVLSIAGAGVAAIVGGSFLMGYRAHPASAPTPPASSVAVVTPLVSTLSEPLALPTLTPAQPAADLRRPRAIAVKPKNDCNPPYTVDAQGIRHFKEACL